MLAKPLDVTGMAVGTGGDITKMRVLEFHTNPFRDIAPGGSPTERWANPPQVYLGLSAYLLLFLWDRTTMVKRQPADTLRALDAEHVIAQGIVRDTDGAEFYLRVIDGKGCILIPTGFRGNPFTPDKTQQPKQEIPAMTVLEAFHEYIADFIYTDSTPEDRENIKAALAECPDIPETKAYLGWPPEYFQEILEQFFQDTVSLFDVQRL